MKAGWYSTGKNIKQNIYFGFALILYFALVDKNFTYMKFYFMSHIRNILCVLQAYSMVPINNLTMCSEKYIIVYEIRM